MPASPSRAPLALGIVAIIAGVLDIAMQATFLPPPSPVGVAKLLRDAVSAIVVPQYASCITLAAVLIVVGVSLIARARWGPRAAQLWSVAALLYLAASVTVWVVWIWPNLDAVRETSPTTLRWPVTIAKAAPFIDLIYRVPFPIILLLLFRRRSRVARGSCEKCGVECGCDRSVRPSNTRRYCDRAHEHVGRSSARRAPARPIHNRER